MIRQPDLANGRAICRTDRLAGRPVRRLQQAPGKPPTPHELPPLDLDDAPAHLLRSPRRLADIAGDLLRGGLLLLDSRRNARGDLVHFLDGQPDIPDRLDRSLRGLLNLIDVSADVLGGARRLIGDRVDEGDHISDLLRAIGEGFHQSVGLARIADGPGGCNGGLGNLGADLVG